MSFWMAWFANVMPELMRSVSDDGSRADADDASDDPDICLAAGGASDKQRCAAPRDSARGEKGRQRAKKTRRAAPPKHRQHPKRSIALLDTRNTSSTQPTHANSAVRRKRETDKRGNVYKVERRKAGCNAVKLVYHRCTQPARPRRRKPTVAPHAASRNPPTCTPPADARVGPRARLQGGGGRMQRAGLWRNVFEQPGAATYEWAFCLFRES